MQPDHAPLEGIESQISQWLGKRGKSLATIILSVVLLTTVIATYQSYQRRNLTSAAFQAHRLAQKLSGPDRKSATLELQTLMDHYSSIEDLYRSTLVHAGLQAIWSDGSSSAPKEPLFLSSTSVDEAKFISYSKTSFTIARGDYQRALLETLEQRKVLDASDSSLPTLELFLLLRTISLHHKLGNKGEAADIWQQLLAKRQEKSGAFSSFAFHLREGSMEIDEYPIYQQ